MGIDEQPARNVMIAFANTIYSMLDGPITWFREKIVEPNRPTYYYYHRKYRRVPTIDQCYTDDLVCFYEANEQFKRDKRVENEILHILRQRRDDCAAYEQPDHMEKCAKVIQDFKEAELNWFIKYGDIGGLPNVKEAYMKQKHRMIWERRQKQKAEQEGAE